MEEIEELIERITDIKDDFDFIFRMAENAYMALAEIKDHLRMIEIWNREETDES